MKQFMLAGVSSGVGKTTITLGILKALANRNLVVQPYKVGPDYIDTAYHTRIAKRPSRNLDSFMIPDEDRLKWSYSKWHQQADVAVIEGVMGFYDGLGTDKDCASSAEIAKKMGVPVILIVDGKATSTSAAAIVHGFASFDKDVNIAGVIINRVASQNHYELIKGAIERYTNVEVLGYFPKNINVELPSRHLGLIPDVEMENLDKTFDTLGELAEQYIQLDRLLEIADLPRVEQVSPFKTKDYTGLKMAYALDDAFHFYYEDNLDLLKDLGVELIPFSPLKDKSLPKADVYYFGGGFPEIYAKELAENQSFRQSVYQASINGAPIYAECGGLMYLGKYLETDGQIFDMVGVFDGKSVMTPRLKKFGYCQATTKVDSLFGKAGTQVRGHEFHHSTFETNEPTVLDMEKTRDGEVVSRWDGGYKVRRTFASYLHVHFYQNEELLFNWLDDVKEATNK
ncbi:cobyrinate a,c-diamide synthase [Granulicatella sp. zg-ZJ]|uniref:cobyrinate a,c-diamide synthase n=1 Tax=Granulicatella sp. zg-ZJ TaxID=2678504 RepID=UPI0013D01848|nr:cobyrinate a,c-diamide synthase [Granulicatella sp. zg-ZJ]NEW61849.1 cobyrinate a,c-diamide synthase [Granulicatella sp. zg-ZJ]